METNFIFKVTPRGGGKTRWLVDKVEEAVDAGNQVWMWCGNPIRYHMFLELFYSVKGRICTVHRALSINDIPEGAIVLIDDLLDSGLHTNEVAKLDNLAGTVYITLNGKTDRKRNIISQMDNQISMFEEE